MKSGEGSFSPLTAFVSEVLGAGMFNDCVHFTFPAYPICKLRNCECPGRCLEYQGRVTILQANPSPVSKAGWPKRCNCGTIFAPGSNRQSLCSECGDRTRRAKQRGYMQAFRARKEER